MHDSVTSYVAEQVDCYRLAGRSVLEVGSLDVNGSVRSMFHGPYMGMDLNAGPGVDVVSDFHDWGHKFAGYEVILCLEMLEHDTEPWVTAENIRRNLAEGGTAIVTARGYVGRHAFPEHMLPHDYWRFSVEGMRHLLEWAGLTVLDCRPDPERPGVLATVTVKVFDK